MFNIDVVNPYQRTATAMTSSTDVYQGNSLTLPQIQVLETVHSSYSNMLADKKYENIPSNYAQYIRLINQLKAIHVYDDKLQLLIQIAENALVGAVNVNAIYSGFAYNEIKINLLNKRIQEILSDKNVMNTATDGISGQINMVKVFKLSPLYSYYIQLYGMPEFGVGFDPVRIAFLQNIPELKEYM